MEAGEALGIAIGAILCGVLGALLLAPSDRAGPGFALGALLGPIGVLIALVMRANAAGERRA